MSRTFRTRHMFLFATLLGATSVAFAQSDPAYVDGPGGRIADSARADGGTDLNGQAAADSPRGMSVDSAGQQMMMAQMQAMAQMQRQAMAQDAQNQSPEQAFINSQTAGSAMAPSGGAMSQSGMSQNGMPQSGMPQNGTPAQQIQSGLIQDAAGLIDAGIQRQVYGPNGSVVTYPPPARAPAANPAGW